MGQTMCGPASIGMLTMRPQVAAHTMPGGQGMGGVVGTWWSDVAALKLRLDPTFKATDADVTRCAGTLPAGEVAAWEGFYAAWRAYADDPGGYVFGSGEAYDTGLAFELQLQAWRDQLRKDGCAPSTPDLPVPPQSPAEFLVPALKWGAIGLGIVGAIYAVGVIRSVV